MRQTDVLRDSVAAIRGFNRFYTRKIGVLEEGLLDSSFSLAEVRVLFEMAQKPGVLACELERDLGLDAGYLSRMLARLTARRLVRGERSSRDGRQRALSLTAQGSRVFEGLNVRSSQEIERMIAHLAPADRDRLAGLMRSIRHLLSGTKHDVVLRDPRPGDLGWVVQRHGALYAQEYGWNEEFEALVARIVADYIQHRRPERERCWIATLEGEPVGCVFLVQKTRTIAKLRLLLVEPSARGCGVGGKLVAACTAFARQAGYRRVELWTNSVLTAARRIYERAGFKRIASERHHSFGKDLVAETWALDLT